MTEERREKKMRSELRELEQLVKRVAENVEGEGNVAETKILLEKPVVLDHGFRGRFSWGAGKVMVEAVKSCKIVGFTFSEALLAGETARFSTREGSWLDDYVPLTALPSEILKKIAREAGL